MTRIVNLTGRDLHVYDEQATGDPIRIPGSSKRRARVYSVQEQVDEVEIEGLAVPIMAVKSREIGGVPDPKEGVLYIVSGLVASAASWRSDLAAPARMWRSQGGTVEGFRALLKP